MTNRSWFSLQLELELHLSLFLPLLALIPFQNGSIFYLPAQIKHLILTFPPLLVILASHPSSFWNFVTISFSPVHCKNLQLNFVQLGQRSLPLSSSPFSLYVCPCPCLISLSVDFQFAGSPFSFHPHVLLFC